MDADKFPANLVSTVEYIENIDTAHQKKKKLISACRYAKYFYFFTFFKSEHLVETGLKFPIRRRNEMDKRQSWMKVSSEEKNNANYNKF